MKTTITLRRIAAVIMCMCFLSCAVGGLINASITDVRAGNSTEVLAAQDNKKEDIKARLMRQITEDGWDPYSADMTLEEFYALMELFDEGQLPLNQVSAYALINSAEENEASCIPRTKFMFAGLGNYSRRDGSEDNDAPQEYNNNDNYEQIESAEGDAQYHYPAGLDPYGSGYMRPPEDWHGINIENRNTNRVVLVSEDANADNAAVAGNVIQDLFAAYSGYYVKQVTVDGANINVLGLIELGDGRCVYYYLSAEGQSTQVSTTTLPDEAKFIVEYVPSEHQIEYKVRLGNDDVTTERVPEGVVFYNSDRYTAASWKDSIFGANPSERTTDGAYSFDVVVPFGYELQILISINMTIDIPYTSRPDAPGTFFVEINHTGSKEVAKKAWMDAYSAYLKENGFIADDIRNHITETEDGDGKITLTWKDDTDPDKHAHDSVLAKMSERINDFILHNNGYPLGMYPDYSVLGPGGFKILPDSTKSPTTHTMNDTFYNHLVKADRTITAVLKKQSAPTFDVSQILQKSSGAADRGSSATEEFASRDYDADYEFHLENGTSNTLPGDPSVHGSVYPNVQSADSWSWKSGLGDFSNPRNMKRDSDGTYSYSWVFQTNTGDDHYLDVLEVNGIALQIPYYPKYNWNDSYTVRNEVEKADYEHPYFTETKLADGATLRLEFLLGWKSSGGIQRHYRVTVTGARSNVVVTGLNLMQYGGGADEFATYNLVGVYSDRNGESQTAPAIEYYSKNIPQNTGVKGWLRTAQSNVVVDNIEYTDGDPELHGANIRFKITEGYGNPTYSWTNRHGDVIGDQTSGNNPIIPLESVDNLSNGEEGALINGKLDSRYIYEGGDGYYYIRVTTQSDYKMALLSVIARTVKYTVRYMPEYNDGSDTWRGFVIDEDGELSKASEVEVDHDSMPTFNHDPAICDLWDMARDESGEVPEKYREVLHQYDDNGGPFYDLIFNTMATIASDAYGTIRPKDTTKQHTFANWVLVGEDFMPVKDENGNPIQFLGGAIDLTKYAHYAVKHVAFGNADTDIHVIRLMPVWKPINNPFTYNVVLNWVDTLGNIHAEDFSDYWDEVVTDMTVNGKVYVYLNKDADPLLDWIANHPTYTFWDSVNNATTPEEIKDALDVYLKGETTKYSNILDALMQKNFTDINGETHTGNDSFDRLGKDIFVVNQDNGKICIWMYENKGGLIFHKDVLEEPFEADDEFYFTVTDANVGDNFNNPLNGEYKAYPQFVYDEDGNPRALTNDDAWLVKFENGRIVSVDGDTNVTYFTLRSGDGVALYVPSGQYTIAELGSKSGGSYKAKVSYTAADGSAVPDEDWEIPDEEGLWLRGKSTEYIGTQDPDVSQVSATVNFEIGEHNVVQTLTFCNQTSSLAIEKEVRGDYDGDPEFTFDVKLKLPDEVTPLQADDGSYYFNYNLYDMDYSKDVNGIMSSPESGRIVLTELTDNPDFNWKGTVKLKAGQRLIIVMTVPDMNSTINYSVQEIEIPNGYKQNGSAEARTGGIGAGQMALEKIVNITDDRAKGSLTVKNEIEGKTSAQDFTFTVTLDEELDGEYGGMVFTKGVATFTLKAGESKTAEGLPDGIGYTITETPAGGYTLETIKTDAKWIDGTGHRNPPANKITTDVPAKTATGSIAENQHHTVTFINASASVEQPELPSTGGTGITLFCIFGVLLTASGLYLLRRKAE
ncbi:MAG: LPXTG cell wall anchor domain-containing protein [Oscillospiraceae bacterium]|nr:LPXTG cell wall anchor domain-containing protein [Oscillospiraceae bacterium]